MRRCNLGKCSTNICYAILRSNEQWMHYENLKEQTFVEQSVKWATAQPVYTGPHYAYYNRTLKLDKIFLWNFHLIALLNDSGACNTW